MWPRTPQQVDPILDELTEVLAEINPMTPEVPFYSATLFDPRESPVCGAGYWVDNLRNMVRFSAAVQAAFEDGYRVFAELAPHPLLTHALEQTARSIDVPLAALASMRREQAMPYGLRDFLIDLHSAGAAVDFSVLYPNGRLVDAPLPTWTHRQLMLSSDGQESRHMAVTPFRYIRCWARMCACRRNRSATCGRPRSAPPPSPGSPTTRSATWPCCRGRLTARWRWRPRAPCWARPPRSATCHFQQALLLDEQHYGRRLGIVVIAGCARLHRGDESGGEAARQATAVLHAADDEQPPAYDMSALLAAHPRYEDGAEVRKGLDQRGVQYGPAFTGLGTLHIGEGANRHRAGRGRVAGPNPLATRCLRCAPGAAGCLFPVRWGQPGRASPGRRCAGVAVGHPSTPLLRFCPHRPLLLHPGDESRRVRDRGRPRRARPARKSPADRAGAAMRHRGLRERPRRTGAGRAAAGNRVAATRIARRGIHRRRQLAVDFHHRHRGCDGCYRVDRRPEKPWRAMHHDVLAGARRPHLNRRTAQESAARRRIQRRGDPRGTGNR